MVYLANLLGRPGARLAGWSSRSWCWPLTLGILTGFVANASGRLDVRTGFERFIAARHVSVFRPRLLLGVLGVLLLGIVPAGGAGHPPRRGGDGGADPHPGPGPEGSLAAAKALHDAQEKSQSPTAMMTALSVGGVGVG